MKDNISIIKKVFILQLFILLSLTLFAEPYKPYPILFVHGIAANSEICWGAGTYKEGNQWSDFMGKDSIETGSTYDHFLDYMTKYSWAWYDWEVEQGLPPSYTFADTQSAYPNKTFLEVLNFDAIPVSGKMKTDASIDSDLSNSKIEWRYRGECRFTGGVKMVQLTEIQKLLR
jgi:hypothetical protein